MNKPITFQNSISNEEAALLPAIEFRGPIVVVDSEPRLREACRYLAAQPVIGFDTETRPSFRAGVVNRVALLQLSSPEQSFLFRLCKIPLDKAIVKILENKEILKIGADVKGDLRALHNIRHFQEAGFVDLQELAGEWGIEEKSLRKLSAIVLGQRVSKAQRLSNWEAAQLTDKQQLYAATDAWVCTRIYDRLLHTPKPKKTEEMIPQIHLRQRQGRVVAAPPSRGFSRARSNPSVTTETKSPKVPSSMSIPVRATSSPGDITRSVRSPCGCSPSNRNRSTQAWWQRTIATALDVRRTLGLTDDPDTTCYRLVHGEGDSLPGLVVDIYGTTAVIQCHSVGMYHARLTDRRCDPNGLRRPDHRHLRQKFANRTVQGRPESRGRVPVRQNAEECAAPCWKTAKNSCVNWEEGQKTGFFIDQRENRELVTPLRPRTHGPQHLLLHGRILGLCPCGRRTRKSARWTPRSGPSRWPTRERAAQLRRRGSPHFAGRRCRRIPQGHRRPVRPDHPRPAGLRQAPQSAGQCHAGLQAAQCPGAGADQKRRAPLHFLLFAGGQQGVVPHHGLLGRRPSPDARSASCTN